jgi:hypothetical protein
MTPEGLVAPKLDFDKNPRLETVVGFFVRPRPPPATESEE